MGKCPKVFRTVAAAMRHVVKHRPNATAPTGREKSLWQVRWNRRGEIAEVLSSPPQSPLD